MVVEKIRNSGGPIRGTDTTVDFIAGEFSSGKVAEIPVDHQTGRFIGFFGLFRFGVGLHIHS